MPNPRIDLRKHAYVVFRKGKGDSWELLGEFPLKPGLPARAARARAILEASGGDAKPGDAYAAVLRSEWKLAQVW